ncbi:electron transport complex subunit RsxC [Dasania sp. GY-MA-18]|uniref:Ion-translocating oxidoreductase complex subunit C n=2 Tax=Spongiibacteraceae TaxID=1706375 RepID=A0A9J6RPY1_9GAMM|nr:electron transport complex subunit RsxC [Dasania sp. GY-MA-18]MCZ0866361.1 electron transport complex subunit RsxC [Dasania phycosphaerae]MCZ0870085.1 electron transport complex subunit RsxC [Dasania phycosphaerae]
MPKTYPTPGGVHPPQNKAQSTSRPIQQASLPAELVLPLSQHAGAPAKAIVAVGDKVLKGQCIAQAKGSISAYIHAPSSGEVTAIEPRAIPHASGMQDNCIVIKTDGEDNWCPLQGCEDFSQLPASELVEQIRLAGITGLGGGGFPTAVKLISSDTQASLNKAIDTLIINGTECEPYITADDLLMRERAQQIISGIQILQHIIKPSTATLIGVENNKPEAIAALEAAIAEANANNITVVSFAGKYPSGGEKQLIQILTGREVPSGGLPADVGIVCQNVGTVAAVHDAIVLGKPLISRITTVTGQACAQPQNFEVLIGSPIAHVLAQAGFDASACQRLIMGGPMMGFTLTDTSVPVIKATNCLLAATEAELPSPPPAQACIRCGMCAEACPASLLPQQLYWYARSKEYEKLEELNLFDCIECGACSYVCPSTIPLVQYYRASKADIREHKAEMHKAEQSKARFEARQQRLEREEQEKAEKRAARQAAAKAKLAAAAQAGGEQELDPVQAAVARAKAKKAAKAAAAETEAGNSTAKPETKPTDEAN